MLSEGQLIDRKCRFLPLFTPLDASDCFAMGPWRPPCSVHHALLTAQVASRSSNSTT